MKFKKNWFGYIVWILSAAVIATITAGYSMLLSMKYLFSQDLGPVSNWMSASSINYQFGIILVCIISILFISVLFFVLAGIGQKASLIAKSQKTHAVINWILAALIFIGACAYRVMIVLNTNLDVVIEQNPMDIVLQNEGAYYSYTGNVIFYLITSAMEQIVPGKIGFVILQSILQCLTLIVLYIAVKKLVGSIPALVVEAIFGYMFIFVQKIVEVKAECLYFFLFSIALFILSFLVEPLKNGKTSELFFILAIVIGMIIGALVYIDPVAILLLYLCLGILFMTTDGRNLKYRIASFVLIFISSIIFLVISFLVEATVSGGSIISGLNNWFQSIMQISLPIPDLYTSANHESALIEGFIIAACAFLLVIGFFRKSYLKQNLYLVLLIIFPTPITRVSFMLDSVYAILVWSILAGIGLEIALLPEGNVDEAIAQKQCHIKQLDGDCGEKQKSESNEIGDLETNIVEQTIRETEQNRIQSYGYSGTDKKVIKEDDEVTSVDAFGKKLDALALNLEDDKDAVDSDISTYEKPVIAFDDEMIKQIKTIEDFYRLDAEYVDLLPNNDNKIRNESYDSQEQVPTAEPSETTTAVETVENEEIHRNEASIKDTNTTEEIPDASSDEHTTEIEQTVDMMLHVLDESENMIIGQELNEIIKPISKPIAKPASKSTQKAINYIPNPLPGPKKHVPKNLSYGLEIAEDDIDFDFDVDDDDDFDV